MFGTFWQRLVVGREFLKDGFRKCFSYMVTHDAPLTVVMKKGPWSASHFSPKLAKRSSFPIVQPLADIIIHLEHTNGDERLCGCRKAKIPYSTLHSLWSQYHKTYWQAHRDCEDMFSTLRLLLVKMSTLYFYVMRILSYFLDWFCFNRTPLVVLCCCCCWCWMLNKTHGKVLNLNCACKIACSHDPQCLAHLCSVSIWR